MSSKKEIFTCGCSGQLELLYDPEVELDDSITQMTRCDKCGAEYTIKYEPVSKHPIE